MEDNLKLYAVRNSEGQWFHRKGYGGYGNTWVEKFSQARIYTRIGHARAIVSFFANNYKGYPPPELVCLHVGEIEVIDETERVEKAKRKKEAEEERREIAIREYNLQKAQQDLEDAKRRLAAAKKGKNERKRK